MANLRVLNPPRMDRLIPLAITSGRPAPVDGRRAREIVLAVAERGVPKPPSWLKRTGRPATNQAAQTYPDGRANLRRIQQDPACQRCSHLAR
jgi:hypothetical protein